MSEFVDQATGFGYSHTLFVEPSRSHDGVFVSADGVHLSRADTIRLRDELTEFLGSTVTTTLADGQAGDVIGLEVWVTGDTDEWGHGVAPGTLVRIARDDVIKDGSYEVVHGPGGAYENYVGANDLTVHPPRLVFHSAMCEMCR